MRITKSDVIWNYGATFMKIASSALLLPFILKMMPSETVGIWMVFMTITAFTTLLDFGFGPSFTRNITYVFSGVKTLKVSGFESVTDSKTTVDYGLLKGVIAAMRWFYLRMSAILFLLLISLGTYYIYSLLKNYSGNHKEVYIAWLLLCLISTYNLYTLYYDALLQGKGLIKRSKQIVVIGQTFYLVIAAILIMYGNGLIAIVSAQASSVVIIRWLSYNSFFSLDIKSKLHEAVARPKQEIINAIYPNAVKIGLTSLGGFMVQRSAMVIGSLYLSLTDIASYGITVQLISVIAGLSGIYISTFQPKITQLRVLNDNESIKKLYLKGQLILLSTYLVCGIGLLLLGESVLKIIGSHTQLIPGLLLFFAVFTSFLETNLSIAGSILLTKNEVPFFKASLISGAAIIIGLVLMFNLFKIGLGVLIFVPLFVDLSYQAWKWPMEAMKDLKMTVIWTNRDN